MGNFFVNRPIVAMVIAVFMVIIGTVMLGGLPIEQYPDIAKRLDKALQDHISAITAQ